MRKIKRQMQSVSLPRSYGVNEGLLRGCAQAAMDGGKALRLRVVMDLLGLAYYAALASVEAFLVLFPEYVGVFVKRKGLVIEPAAVSSFVTMGDQRGRFAPLSGYQPGPRSYIPYQVLRGRVSFLDPKWVADSYRDVGNAVRVAELVGVDKVELQMHLNVDMGVHIRALYNERYRYPAVQKIVEGRMTIEEAAVICNRSVATVTRWYQQFVAMQENTVLNTQRGFLAEEELNGSTPGSGFRRQASKVFGIIS